MMDFKYMQTRLWETEFQKAIYLANLRITSGGGVLSLEMQDVENDNRFRIRFASVLGYRFEEAFSEERLMNGFIVTNSPWIEEMRRRPFRVKDISAAVHYIISTKDGELDVVCLEKPQIEVERPTKG